MKLSFVTIGESDHIAAWSGIPLFMSRAFSDVGFDVNRIQRLRGPRSVYLKARSLFRAKVLRENYSTFRHQGALEFYARQVDSQIEERNPDVVASCSSLPLAFLRTKKPLVLWTDATFAGLIDFYPAYVGVSKAALREGHKAEQAILDRCALAIYSSEWAAQSAIEHYNADPRKIKVVPFGANFPAELSPSQAEKTVDDRSEKVCKLLFLGVDWKRKGGDEVVQVAERLNRRGIKTKLAVVGGVPPNGKAVPECVELVGFMDKNTPGGNERLRNLLMESHFLVILSSADCTPIVFSEANSFAVPCISTDVGGISSIVKNGVNGFHVGLENAVEEATEVIARLFADRRGYRVLALRSFEEYTHRLNWWTSAEKVRELICHI